MQKIRKRWDSIHWKARLWFTPLRVLGLILTGLGVLVLLIPQILVILAASLLIFSGILIFSLGETSRCFGKPYPSWTLFRYNRVHHLDPFFWE